MFKNSNIYNDNNIGIINNNIDNNLEELPKTKNNNKSNIRWDISETNSEKSFKKHNDLDFIKDKDFEIEIENEIDNSSSNINNISNMNISYSNIFKDSNLNQQN